VDDEETIYPTPVSDEQILAQVNKIIRGLGLDVNPDLDFTALVENGVVTLDGTVLYPDEESLIQSVGSIQGVVKIISNFELLAE
jgi:osmotically-inducible protein OsmY